MDNASVNAGHQSIISQEQIDEIEKGIILVYKVE
jgi:hypothetical protein